MLSTCHPHKPWTVAAAVSAFEGASRTPYRILGLFSPKYWDIPGGSDGKMSVYNAGDLGSIPGSGRSPGEGNGNPLQYSCLENPMDRGAW